MEYKVPKSTLQLQTVRVSILIGDALADSPHRFGGANSHTNGHPPGDTHNASLMSPIDFAKVPLSDEKSRKRKIDENQDSLMSSEILGEKLAPHEFCIKKHRWTRISPFIFILGREKIAKIISQFDNDSTVSLANIFLYQI